MATPTWEETTPLEEIPQWDSTEPIEKEPQYKTPGLFGSSLGENTKAMAYARIPAILAKGLSKGFMDQYDPQTKSVLLNALLRTPQTLTSIGLENLSNTITPEQAAVAGTLKGTQLATPAIKATGRFIGKGAEELSGLSYKTPGVLAEAVKDPSLITKPGIETANEIFAEKVDPAKIRDIFKMSLGKKEMVQTAIDSVTDGTITPDEALISRQALDSIRNTLPRASYFNIREILDKVAKTKFEGADRAYKTAVKSEALRELFPLNKTGGISKLLTAVGVGGVAGGMATNPAFLLTAPAFSPAIQGVAASGLGVAGRAISPLVRNPILGTASQGAKILKDKIAELKKKQKEGKKQ